MRKITKEAAEAFWSGKPFQRRGNGATTVIVDDTTVLLLLHDNPIARRPRHSERLEISAAGHPGPTTKGRLNGVLCRLRLHIWQEAFVWHCLSLVPDPLVPHIRLRTITLETGKGAWTLVYAGSDLEQLAAVKGKS